MRGSANTILRIRTVPRGEEEGTGGPGCGRPVGPMMAGEYFAAPLAVHRGAPAEAPGLLDDEGGEGAGTTSVSIAPLPGPWRDGIVGSGPRYGGIPPNGKSGERRGTF